MKKIFFLGGGGLFKEYFYYVKEYINSKNLDFKISGIIENSNRTIDSFSKLKIFKENKIKPQKDIFLILSIGEIKKRITLINKFKKFNFFKLIHPGSYVSSGAKIGKGCVVSPGAIVTGNAVLDDFNLLNNGSYVTHDCKIDKNNCFSPGSKILGYCRVGENNFFGSSVVVIPKIKIGKNNIIGANSTVINNIKNNSLIVGSPAKIKKK